MSRESERSLSESPIEGPVITKPEDEELVAKLERKLQEYHDRLGEDGAFKHPGQLIAEDLLTGSRHRTLHLVRIELLQRVLNEDQVPALEFADDIFKNPIFLPWVERAPAVLLEVIEQSCGVIDAYTKNDPSQLKDGTGLN